MPNIVKFAEIQNCPLRVYIAYPGELLEVLPEGTVTIPMSAAEKIESFGELQTGWDYGAGEPVEKSTTDAAHTWNRLLTMIGFETDASPGSEGEVSVAGSRGPYYLEVIVESDQSTSVAFDFKGHQEYYRLNQPTIDVLGSVLDVAEQIWSASTSYTPGNTTTLNISGFGPHFETIRGPSPYFPLNASGGLVSQSADIFGYITGTSNTYAANLPFSGGSTRMISHTGQGLALRGPLRTAIISSKG